MRFTTLLFSLLALFLVVSAASDKKNDPKFKRSLKVTDNKNMVRITSKQSDDDGKTFISYTLRNTPVVSEWEVWWYVFSPRTFDCHYTFTFSPLSFPSSCHGQVRWRDLHWLSHCFPPSCFRDHWVQSHHWEAHLWRFEWVIYKCCCRIWSGFYSDMVWHFRRHGCSFALFFHGRHFRRLRCRQGGRWRHHCYFYYHLSMLYPIVQFLFFHYCIMCSFFSSSSFQVVCPFPPLIFLLRTTLFPSSMSLPAPLSRRLITPSPPTRPNSTLRSITSTTREPPPSLRGGAVRASLRFKKRLNLSINPRKLYII